MLVTVDQFIVIYEFFFCFFYLLRPFTQTPEHFYQRYFSHRIKSNSNQFKILTNQSQINCLVERISVVIPSEWMSSIQIPFISQSSFASLFHSLFLRHQIPHNSITQFEPVNEMNEFCFKLMKKDGISWISLDN